MLVYLGNAAGWVMPGDLWPGQVRSFMEKRDHTYRAIRVR
jgi:hypothetical protein